MSFSAISQAALALYDEYREGRFPMAETADGPAMIVVPRERGLLPIIDLHISRSLMKSLRKGGFEIRINTAFDDVLTSCAQATPDRPETWINPEIRILFNELHLMGRAHSVEYWQEGNLAGGLYGLAVGGVFCGESMFSRVTDASKVALIHLCAHLWDGKFSILDAQFYNSHLEQFGLYTLKQAEYVRKLNEEKDRDCLFPSARPDVLGAYLQARSKQT